IISGWRSAGPEFVGVALIGLLSVAPFVAALGHLCGVTGAGGFGPSNSASTMTVFNAGEPMLWILALITALFSVFVALWIGTRRARMTGIDWRRTWQLPAVVFGAWLIVGTI